MLGPRSSRFHQAALQSGLIDEAGLAACWELIAPERRTPEAIDRRLARQTISTGRLTLWQAQQLLAGRVSGFQIDKYILLNLLGRGGMGRVFLARDVRLNRMVALKLLSQERMNNPRAIARFRREAKVGAQLQHGKPRPGLRRGGVGRCPLSGDGTHRWQERRPVDRRPGQGPLADRRPPRPPGCARAGTCPAQGPDPPRRQPMQHPHHPGRNGQTD